MIICVFWGLTGLAICAKLKLMRYFFILSLLFLPLVSYAQYFDDDEATQMSGSSTAHTSSSATSGRRMYKSKYLTKHKIKEAQPKAKPQKKPSAEIGSSDRSEQGIKEVLKTEAKQYHEEGYKLQTNGDYRGALTYYQKAAELDRYSPVVLNDLGVVYEALGDEISAVNVYRKAIDIDSEYLASYANLALFYEEKGDSRNASYYWQKRYEKGKEGEYWREEAARHLMRLGTYPEVKRDLLEREAATLSRELSRNREIKNKSNTEEAKLHYYIGQRLVIKGDNAAALKEFESALALNPSDQDLREKIIEAYKNAQKYYSKDKVLADTKDALQYIKAEDFNSAESKLRSALSAAYRAAQEK